MKIFRLTPNDPLWKAATDYAENASWVVGKHLAQMMREEQFFDWETVFFAMEGERFAGFCTFLKTDYYPENRYSPWISSIFVEEGFRGNRLSHLMIETAIEYARTKGFRKVYIPSDMSGFYEKCGFTKIDQLVNYGGDTDDIFAKDI